MRYFYSIAGCVAALLLLASSCNDTTSPDPCSGSRPVTASFTMYETLYNTAVPADTVLVFRSIHFAADEKYDSYEWRIGDDPRVFTDSVVVLRFEQPEGDVDVRLIARRAPNTSCYPNDDGIDTVTKRLHVISVWPSPRILGSYHGYNTDAPKDTFTFSLDYRDLGEHGKNYVLNNLNKGCSEPAQDGATAIVIYVGYRAFQFIGEGWVGQGCLSPNGVAVLQGDGDSIKVEYTIIDRSDPRKIFPKTFVGRRVIQ